jgi:hypothetical protein
MKPWERKERLLIPKIMNQMMLASTGNSTLIHFGMSHLCHKHNKLFNLEHIKSCKGQSSQSLLEKEKGFAHSTLMVLLGYLIVFNFGKHYITLI